MPRSDEVSATWEGDGKLGVTFMTDPDGVRQGPVRLDSRRSLLMKARVSHDVNATRSLKRACSSF